MVRQPAMGRGWRGWWGWWGWWARSGLGARRWAGCGAPRVHGRPRRQDPAAQPQTDSSDHGRTRPGSARGRKKRRRGKRSNTRRAPASLVGTSPLIRHISAGSPTSAGFGCVDAKPSPGPGSSTPTTAPPRAARRGNARPPVSSSTALWSWPWPDQPGRWPRRHAADRLTGAGLTPSLGRTGVCGDNTAIKPTWQRCNERSVTSHGDRNDPTGHSSARSPVRLHRNLPQPPMTPSPSRSPHPAEAHTRLHRAGLKSQKTRIHQTGQPHFRGRAPPRLQTRERSYSVR